MLLDPRKIRKIVLAQCRRANVGHIGSALCTAEILAVLYGSVLRLEEMPDTEHDRFILSKGHAALALYAALYLRGLLTQSGLDTYCADGSLLGVHPCKKLKGIDFSTGSLGHGLAVGAGAALGARQNGSSRRVFVLLSDAECNEGSVWESVMFAAQHQLANLVAIVDVNGQQALGPTRGILAAENLCERFRVFGWDADEVDGHDTEAITAKLGALNTSSGSPHALLARTIFGKGVSFMEGQLPWHYFPVDDKQYAQAMQELEERES
jgi:transketolase